MRYAETGYNLEIDLTRGNIEQVETDPKDTELYLCGLGTNAKIMWDRVGPEADAFSPENVLIFGAGLLCGTPATGCNRTILTTISPMTNLMAFSMMKNGIRKIFAGATPEPEERSSGRKRGPKNFPNPLIKQGHA